MEQNKVQATTGITFRVLVALSICHCLNDTLQSVISAVYPLFKEDLGLSFAQIGLITLVYQSAASVCQPLTGLFFDKWPSAWSLPTGMSFTLVGLLSLAFAGTLPLVLCSVALVGIGSSVFHPEASRLTSSHRAESEDWHNRCSRSGEIWADHWDRCLLPCLLLPMGGSISPCSRSWPLPRLW